MCYRFRTRNVITNENKQNKPSQVRTEQSVLIIHVTITTYICAISIVVKATDIVNATLVPIYTRTQTNTGVKAGDTII